MADDSSNARKIAGRDRSSSVFVVQQY